MNKQTLTLKHHILIQCFLCLFVANLADASPRIACDAPKYDFETVIGEDKITREFVLQNRGDSTLKITKIKDCCGVKSTITPMEILPGSKGKGTIEVKKLSDSRWQLKLRAIPDKLTSGSVLQIKTSCDSQSAITIPLSVR